MALQDLTPQLRTRLNRMEKSVGWFVLVAAALLLFGLGYYVYATAETKGWFKRKSPYYLYVRHAGGLHVKDKVVMMGREVGEVRHIELMEPGSENDVYIEISVVESYEGYIWTVGSKARVVDQFLGKRTLEISKGTAGYPTYMLNPFHDKITLAEAKVLPELRKWSLGLEIYQTNGAQRTLLFKPKQFLSVDLLNQIAGLGIQEICVFDTRSQSRSDTAVWRPELGRFVPFIPGKTAGYELPTDEPPSISDRAEALISQVEKALPSFLSLTNQISSTLSNAQRLTLTLNGVGEDLRPSLTNVSLITANLRNPNGSLGQWAIPTNLNQDLALALLNANGTLTNVNTNLLVLVEGIGKSLESLAGITSNLHRQVDANTNMLTRISDTILHSDEMIQGLKHHWLLRTAFKTPKTNAVPANAAPVNRTRSPRGP